MKKSYFDQSGQEFQILASAKFAYLTHIGSDIVCGRLQIGCRRQCFNQSLPIFVFFFSCNCQRHIKMFVLHYMGLMLRSLSEVSPENITLWRLFCIKTFVSIYLLPWDFQVPVPPILVPITYSHRHTHTHTHTRTEACTHAHAHRPSSFLWTKDCCLFKN